MAKKTRKSKESKRVRVTEKEHIETMIKYSERAISKYSSSVDELFKNQVKMLKEQLKNYE